MARDEIFQQDNNGYRPTLLIRQHYRISIRYTPCSCKILQVQVGKFYILLRENNK